MRLSEKSRNKKKNNNNNSDNPWTSRRTDGGKKYIGGEPISHSLSKYPFGNVRTVKVLRTKQAITFRRREEKWSEMKTS